MNEKIRYVGIAITVCILMGLTIPLIKGGIEHTITLHEGWNLIGLPCVPEDSSIEVVLADILDNVVSVWTFYGKTDTWLSYSPGAPSDLTDMVEGRGYWIYMITDATLTITADGYVLKNPSMEEVYDFIKTDKTDENVGTDEYVCRHFAVDFKKNAFDAGYFCYWVYILFQDGAHSIVAFDTTDRGLVYIEPQNDDIVETLQVGHTYLYPEWGTIIDITLIP